MPQLIVETVCTRCGFAFTYPMRYMTRNYDPSLCNGCKAKPVAQVRYGTDYCTPWQGYYDLDDNPIKDGELWMPGVRKCGHKDCVRPSHINGSDTETSTAQTYRQPE